MEDNRLNFDAPLLSVRRFAAPTPPPLAAASHKPPPKRSSLPFYKSDLKTGPISNPGIVPFVWEHSPGRPKDRSRPPARPPAAPKLPPVRIPEEHQQSPESSSEDDDDAFTDAVDTLSRSESFFMNCSVSGVSGFPDAAERPSGSFATDPQVRDFMMERFLPAAQAAAVSSPQWAARKHSRPAKPAEVEEGLSYRPHVPSPYRYRPNFVPQRPDQDVHDDDEEDDDAETDNLRLKACGLLPRFCLMNPLPGIKERRPLPPPPGRRTISPQTRSSHGSVGQAEDENSWEEVYQHKLGHGVQQQVEEGSRVTSESNHLTYWSDSPTADGSSPFRHSAGGVSPYPNEAARTPFQEGTSFLGVPVREKRVSGSNGSDSERNSEVHSDGSKHVSGAIDRTLYVDSVQVRETPHSKQSSVSSSAEMNGTLKPTEASELRLVSKTMEVSLVLKNSDKDVLQPEVSKVDRYMDGARNSKHKENHEVEDQVKTDVTISSPLLPPPLPNTPSESWLCRTLPSVSSKNPPQKSFLGMQFHRKQALQPASTNKEQEIIASTNKEQEITASTNKKQEITEKPVKVQRQIRFADMLTKPLSPESEI